MSFQDPFQGGDWRDRLALIVDTMRMVSQQTDPETMVRLYSERLSSVAGRDGFLSISRRGLEAPKYCIARSSTWKEPPNPWTQRDRLPVLEGGLLGELIFGDEARIIEELDVAEDDPGYEYLQGMRSLVAIPVYDKGVAMNMVVHLYREPAAFDPEVLPQQVWLTNLFSRATHNLVVSNQLKKAHDEMAEEQRAIARFQRSLLPATLPRIPNLDLAVHYRPSGKAGGDYYDIFPLEHGRWGILVADVSGHGTPAAVYMAITHSIVHHDRANQEHPARLLWHLNENLLDRYTRDSGTFVTALYGIYDPAERRFDYALAGHPAPRLKHCDDGSLESIPSATSPPLGMFEGLDFRDRSLVLRSGDQMLMFTDGLSEARRPDGELLGVKRIDQLLSNCALNPEGLIETILDEMRRFTERPDLEDDLTLLVACAT